MKSLSKSVKHKAFVIGHPISHSLSPKLHGYWIKQYGIDGSYEAINCPPEYFVKTIRKLAATGYSGGNVTIPHKEVALMVADSSDPLAKRIGAANTLVFSSGKIHASNTDAYGFTENLKSNGVDFTNVKTSANNNESNALVLGAGGASRAIIVALQEQGMNVLLTNRTLEKAKKLGKEFGCEVVKWEKKEDALPKTRLLVNTTSLGMKGQEDIAIDLSSLPKEAIVNDIIYNPLETKLLTQARMLKLHAVDGLGMLLNQAAPGFEKWFGTSPEVTKELYDELAKNFV